MVELSDVLLVLGVLAAMVALYWITRKYASGERQANPLFTSIVLAFFIVGFFTILYVMKIIPRIS